MVASGLGLTSLNPQRSGSRLGATFNRQFPARAGAPMLLLSALGIVGDSSVGDIPAHSERVVVRIALRHLKASKDDQLLISR